MTGSVNNGRVSDMKVWQPLTGSKLQSAESQEGPAAARYHFPAMREWTRRTQGVCPLKVSIVSRTRGQFLQMSTPRGSTRIPSVLTMTVASGARRRRVRPRRLRLRPAVGRRGTTALTRRSDRSGFGSRLCKHLRTSVCLSVSSSSSSPLCRRSRL